MMMMARMKVPCGNRLDFECYFFRLKMLGLEYASPSLLKIIFIICMFMEIYKIMFFCQQVPQALCRIDERTLFTLSFQST